MRRKRPRRGDALLIIDMISRFAFDDGERMRDAAATLVPTLRTLRAQCHRAGVPVLYVNDNFGRWNTDLQALVRWAAARGSRGRAIATALKPAAQDYFVLKPRHSVFYQTPLPSLMDMLDVRRLILTGIAADSCVLSSATEAHTRGVALWVPANAVAALTSERTERTLAYVRESLRSETAPV
ncbi:isochorismatase family cysteine hydrolase [Dyella sp.]|jgi:nicotinamidase-related amidase|uniref:isochorismatase family cysteine hydrolase n=1 Tax=Dyella sp. TaxID=1869338 RepID=UPI002D7917E7|nr:isochorismatase family cysteine hydrolase [Dyella sp.]HET6433095.1 isochorismatase family cysteine hydrolase [Dyella sp.]